MVRVKSKARVGSVLVVPKKKIKRLTCSNLVLSGKQQKEENKDPAKAEDLVPVSPDNKKAIKRRIKVVEVDKPKA